MQHWAAANPRLAGVILLVMSPVLVGLNFVTVYALDRWYPVLFPLAGVIVFLGALQVVTGRAPKTMRDAPMAYRVLAVAGMIAGGVLGVLANKWLMGEYL